MKSLFPPALILIVLCFGSQLGAEEPKPGKVDVFAMKAVPDGKYSVTLELKDRDEKAVSTVLEFRDGKVASTAEAGKYGRIRGGAYFIGNGVAMVQLRGDGYTATQFWCFKPDGTIEVKEVPDRGEKQMAVRLDDKASR
jgi:hypothetical protein